MEDVKPQEFQHDLFTDASEKQQKPERFTSLKIPQNNIRLSISIEQLLLSAILAILLGCLIFFLGMVRGRSSSDLPAMTSAPKMTTIVPTKQIATPTMAPITAPVAPSSVKVAVTNLPIAPNRNVIVLNNKDTVPNPAKPYTIQLVTYKKRDLAEQEAFELKKTGIFAQVIPSGTYFVVAAGQYENSQEAQKDLGLLRKKYKDCYLRRR